MEKKKKVLVVDDDLDILETLQDRLESSGYTVFKASNGKKALEIVHDDPPDLILMDVVMPDMDGYTALRELKFDDRTAEIPVIIITVKNMLRDVFDLEGATEFIIKPYEMDNLLQRVAKCLGSSSN